MAHAIGHLCGVRFANGVHTFYTYDGNGLRFAVIENGNRTEFITNGNERSDVELITDESGNVSNRYSYDAFGTITSSEETIANRYTYNGEAYDLVTGQYYLRKRFYNPAVCRFTQEDEYRGDGLNLYAFCANNPVNYVDPSGYYESKDPLFVDPTKTPPSPSHTSSAGLGKSMQTDMGISNGTVDFSGFQRQHLVPQQICSNSDLLKRLGFDAGSSRNGIFDVSSASNANEAANTLRQNLIEKGVPADVADYYVSGKTLHDGFHSLYSAEVQNQIDIITASEPQIRAELMAQGLAGDDLNIEVDKRLRSDVENLVDELRVMNQDGVDMYKEKNISGNTYADQDEYHEYFEKKKEEAKKKCNH